MERKIDNNEIQDVVLIGGGIISATLGGLLNELQNNIKMTILEIQNEGAMESSSPWNNAGTGHAGYCELHYTPFSSKETFTIATALDVNNKFELSRQFWSYLIQKGSFQSPKDFVNPVPHLSFVQGEKDVDFLKFRYEKLREHPQFSQMEFTDDFEKMKEWAPLVVEGRQPSEKMAMTRYAGGTDVNFGSLTKKLLGYLEQQHDIHVNYNEDVKDIKRVEDHWEIISKNVKTGHESIIKTKFVFIGAGGASLLLLQKSGIPESHGVGGFPVSGQWLRCDNTAIVNRHNVKVYCRPSAGLPTAVAPHLDKRVINNNHSILFGPFGGFTTRFLKKSSFFNLINSVHLDNVETMLAVGFQNIEFIQYLIQQSLLTIDKRMDALKKLYPMADKSDWYRQNAGKRVQIIKRNAYGKPILQMGTEIVVSSDKSLAALLGASPGASVSVAAMVDLLQRCFSDQVNHQWADKLKEIFPTLGLDLEKNLPIYKKMHDFTDDILQLV